MYLSFIHSFAYGFSPVCTRRWTCMLPWLVKVFSQKAHLQEGFVDYRPRGFGIKNKATARTDTEPNRKGQVHFGDYSPVTTPPSALLLACPQGQGHFFMAQTNTNCWPKVVKSPNPRLRPRGNAKIHIRGMCLPSGQKPCNPSLVLPFLCFVCPVNIGSVFTLLAKSHLCICSVVLIPNILCQE